MHHGPLLFRSCQIGFKIRDFDGRCYYARGSSESTIRLVTSVVVKKSHKGEKVPYCVLPSDASAIPNNRTDPIVAVVLLMAMRISSRASQARLLDAVLPERRVVNDLLLYLLQMCHKLTITASTAISFAMARLQLVFESMNAYCFVVVVRIIGSLLYPIHGYHIRGSSLHLGRRTHESGSSPCSEDSARQSITRLGHRCYTSDLMGQRTFEIQNRNQVSGVQTDSMCLGTQSRAFKVIAIPRYVTN